MDLEERCDECRVNSTQEFRFLSSEEPSNICATCLENMSDYALGPAGFYFDGPQTFPIASKVILKHVATQIEFEELFSNRYHGIQLLNTLLQLVKAFQDKLLWYFESEAGESNADTYLTTKFLQRYQDTTVLLRELVDSWETYQFWTRQPSLLGQMTLSRDKAFLCQLVRAVLPFPSLSMETCMASSDVSDDFMNLIMSSLTIEEKAKIGTALDELASQESEREEQAVLLYSKTRLLEHFSLLQCIHTENTLANLISNALPQIPLNDQEAVLQLIKKSWRTAALNLIACRYASLQSTSERNIIEIRAETRFMCRYFPEHKLALSLCKIWIKWNHNNQESAAREREASLRCLLLVCYHRKGSEVDVYRMLAMTWKEIGRLEDAEVSYIQECRRTRYQSVFPIQHLRHLYCSPS